MDDRARRGARYAETTNAMTSKPDIEIRDGKVVVYFPGSADAAYLTADEARQWGAALVTGAQAARLMTLPTETRQGNATNGVRGGRSGPI